MYGVIVKSCEVGISSGNQALTRCAFDGTDLATPTGIACGALRMSMSNVPGSNRCSAGRHSDSAGVLSFSGVHAGSPEWMDLVVVCGSAGAGD